MYIRKTKPPHIEESDPKIIYTIHENPNAA